MLEKKHYTWLMKPGTLLIHITPDFSAASSYSSFVPNLITHQVFAQELRTSNTVVGY